MNIYAQRLLNAARAVRESPAPKMFDMGHEVHECGTPACVFGHYAHRTDLQDTFCIARSNGWRPRLWTLLRSTKEDVWWDSSEVRAHFGLSEDEQKELFYADGCGFAASSIEAAEYIERFVARKWPTPVTPPDWKTIATLPVIASP